MRRLLLLLPLCSPACVEVEQTRTLADSLALRAHSQLERTLEVWCEGKHLGRALFMREPGGASHVIIQNEHGQDLGLIDALGRAFRHRPHAQSEWLGSGTVTQGAAWILGCEGSLLLRSPLPR